MMKKFTILIVAVFALLFWFLENRRFYHFNNGQDITFWKTFGGSCYIIPGKYLGLFRPSTNYVSTSNVNIAYIIIDNKSKFDFIIATGGDGYSTPTIVKLPNYRVKHYSTVNFNEFADLYLKNDFPNRKTEWLDADIREMRVAVNGKEQ